MAKRINPFKSQGRTNFPPLDDFFNDDDGNDNDQPSKDNVSSDPGNNNTLPRSTSNHSFHSRSRTLCPSELDFSVDMSIGAKAEMSIHNYQIRKYGLEFSVRPRGGTTSPVGTPSPKTKRTSRQLYANNRDDWDRIMDGTNLSETYCSNISFSSMAIFGNKSMNNSNKDGYRTPHESPDQSDDDSNSGEGNRSDFLGKSVIESLVTPEKRRQKLQTVGNGVTFSRGRRESTNSDESSSDYMIDSPAKCTNVSQLSTGSGNTFERMFRDAALRFNEDFNNGGDISKEGDISAILPASAGPDAADRSVSFCETTSFAKSDSKPPLSNKKKKRHRERINHNNISTLEEKESFIKDALQGLNALSSSANPMQKEKIDEISKALQGLGLLDDNKLGITSLSFSGGGGGSLSPSSSQEVSSLESPGLGTPSPNGGETATLQNPTSPANFQLIGLSPIIDKTHTADRKLKSPTDNPFDKVGQVVDQSLNECFTSTPCKGLKHVESHSSLVTEFTQRNLFQEEENANDNTSPQRLGQEENDGSNTPQLGLEILDDGVELVHQEKPICCTLTTVKSEESYPDSSHEEEESPDNKQYTTRRFGSDATSRINSEEGVNSIACSAYQDRGHTRGVRLSRLSKLKELGLEHVVSRSSRTSEVYGESSF